MMSKRKIIIKTNMIVTFNYMVLLGLFLKGISVMDFNSIEIIDAINLFATLLLTVMIIKTLFSPYIVIEGDSITIFRDTFNQKTFLLNDVEKLVLKESYFSSSYFLLKGQEKVKFNAYALKKNDKSLLGQFFSLPNGTSKVVRTGVSL